MKNLKYLFSVLLLAAFVGLISWNTESNSTAQREQSEAQTAEMFATTGAYNNFDFRKDTITDAETNTINIGTRDNSVWNTVTTPTNFLSLYTYDIKLRPVSLSGTISIKMVLDASNYKTGTSTDWIAIDSITGTTSARQLQLRSTDATATRYRVRIIGAGTQSSTYQIWSMWKRKN